MSALDSDPTEDVGCRRDVRASGVLSIAGYSNVKIAIDGKQPTLSLSDITTGSINATGLNTGGIVSTGKVTVNDVLAIAGYADVKLAIDGKQPLTGSSNITTGTINASNVTSGILNIAGYSDVKMAIDGSNLRSQVQAHHDGDNQSNVTASGILNIAG
jgi:hypothetical protein